MSARFGREPAPDNVAVFENRRAPPTFRRDASGNVFLRFVTARVLADLNRTPIERVVEKCWPSDRVLGEIVERAAVAPAMTGVAGWAAELATRVVVDAG